MIGVTILGCGGSGGVPHIGGVDGHGDWGECDPQEPRNRRTRSAIVIGRGGRRLLVDTPADLRAQLLACGIPGVDGILYTHAHADHVLGLDDVRMLNRIAGRPLEAFGTAACLEEITTRFGYAFRPWTPPGFFRPALTAVPVEAGQARHMGGLPVQLFDQDHGFGPSLGIRVGGFAYSTDVVRLDDAAFEVLAGVDTWIVGCFQRAPHRTHADLPTVLDWVSRVKPRRAVLTHMGPDLDWAWLRRNLPPLVEPAHDGMQLAVPD